MGRGGGVFMDLLHCCIMEMIIHQFILVMMFLMKSMMLWFYQVEILYMWTDIFLMWKQWREHAHQCIFKTLLTNNICCITEHQKIKTSWNFSRKAFLITVHFKKDEMYYMYIYIKENSDGHGKGYIEAFHFSQICKNILVNEDSFRIIWESPWALWTSDTLIWMDDIHVVYHTSLYVIQCGALFSCVFT